MSEGMKFTETHEWVRVDGDVATVGITDFAQDQLGDVVFVELPAVGKMLKKGEAFGVVESVKVAADLIAPVSGEVLSKNAALEEEPELINSSPTDKGWIITVRLTSEGELEDLLDEAAYDALAHGD